MTETGNRVTSAHRQHQTDERRAMQMLVAVGFFAATVVAVVGAVAIADQLTGLDVLAAVARYARGL